MTSLLFQEQGFGFWVAFTDLIKPKCASLAWDVWGLPDIVSDSSEIVWSCDARIVWEKPGAPSSTSFWGWWAYSISSVSPGKPITDISSQFQPQMTWLNPSDSYFIESRLPKRKNKFICTNTSRMMMSHRELEWFPSFMIGFRLHCCFEEKP